MSPSKYSDYSRPEQKRLPKIHPVWRGVGFAFVILIPIIAWAGMDVFMQSVIKAGKFPVPADLIVQPNQIAYRLAPNDPYLYVEILAFVAIAFMCYMIFVMLASIITRMVMGDQTRADPYYVPQMTRRRKRL